MSTNETVVNNEPKNDIMLEQMQPIENEEGVILQEWQINLINEAYLEFEKTGVMHNIDDVFREISEEYGI